MNGMIVADKEQASGHCSALVKNQEELTSAIAAFEGSAKDLSELGISLEAVQAIISEIAAINKKGEEAVINANNTMKQFIAEADETVNASVEIE